MKNSLIGLTGLSCLKSRHRNRSLEMPNLSTVLVDGRESATRFSERHRLLITETCHDTHFYDEF